MFQHIGEDQVVELAGLKRKLDIHDASLDQQVKVATGALGRERTRFDARDVAGTGRAQRCRERAGSAANVEDPTALRDHQRLNVGTGLAVVVVHQRRLSASEARTRVVRRASRCMPSYRTAVRPGSRTRKE